MRSSHAYNNQLKNITYVVLQEINTEKVVVFIFGQLEQLKKRKQISAIKPLHYFARVNLSFADVTCLSHEENKLHQPTEQPEGPFFTKGRYLNFFYAVRNLHNTNLKPTHFVCWLQRKLKPAIILKNTPIWIRHEY